MNVQQRQAIERKIVGEIIDVAFDHGYTIRIDNGGDEDEMIPCRTPDEAKAEIMQTDEEYLHFFKYDMENKKWVGEGWVWCVYGNDGWDVVADYSAEGQVAKIIDPIMDRIIDGSALAHEAATNRE